MGEGVTPAIRDRIRRSPVAGPVAIAVAERVTSPHRLRKVPSELAWTVSAARQTHRAAASRDAVIVTGCDSTHFRSALNLLASIERHEPSTPVSFWDLGLAADDRRALAERYPRVSVNSFPYDDYPDYFQIGTSAGQYAWKPVIVETEVAKADSRIVAWLDAGDLVDRRLTWLRRLADGSGLYSPSSPGTVRTWTHPGTLTRLRADEALLDLPNLNGAIVALDAANPRARALATRWSQCAQDLECIAPAGSDRSNHRQDQAVLTVLAHQSGLAPRGACSELSDLLGVSTHRDVE
jgi:hypothetical protein